MRVPILPTRGRFVRRYRSILTWRGPGRIIRLAIVAVAEDKVHRPDPPIQQPGERLDAVPVDQQHTGYLASLQAVMLVLNRVVSHRCAMALHLPVLSDGASREYR